LSLLLTILVGGGILGVFINYSYAYTNSYIKSGGQLTDKRIRLTDSENIEYQVWQFGNPPEYYLVNPAGKDVDTAMLADENGNLVNPESGESATQATAGTRTVTPGAQSTLSDVIARMLAWILYGLTYGLGWILILVTKAMLAVATFNNFTNHKVTTVGWTIIRDVCNNFFIILLLVSAIGTILHQKNYDFRTMMPKILVAAVLINFSKMFFGLMIDASQILMLTFAAPLAQSTGYNVILNSLGLPDLMSLSSAADQLQNVGFSTWNLVAAMLFGAIFTFIALVVIVCITAILMYRIVYMLFLVVLSPLYFLGLAFPAASKYTGQILGDLVKYLIVGPAMMFFIYISLITLKDLGDNQRFDDTISYDLQTTGAGGSAALQQEGTTAAGLSNSNESTILSLSKMGTVEKIINFGLLIGLLVGSLVIGQKLGTKGSSWAGKGMGFLAKQGKRFSGFNLAANKLQQLPGSAAKRVGQRVGTGTLGLAGAVTRGVGGVTGIKGVEKLGTFAGAWRQDVLESRQKAKAKKRGELFKKLGMGEKAQTAWGEFAETGLGKGLKTAATGAGALLGGAAAVAIATAVTGGLAAPILAGLAATYASGGGRLAEIGIGKWGKDRKARREAEETEINERKSKTNEIVQVSEVEREKEVAANLIGEETKRNQSLQLAEQQRNQDLASLDASNPGQYVAQIENAKLNNKNRTTGQGLHADLTAELSSLFHWSSGQTITDKMLNQAKESIRQKSTSYSSYQTQNNVIEDTYKLSTERANQVYDVAATPIKTQAENDHEARVLSRITNPDEKRRWQGEYNANLKLKVDEKDLKDNLDRTIESIERNVTLNPFERNEQKKSAQVAYDRDLSVARDTRNKAVEAVQPVRKYKENITDRFLSDYAPYAHPNWVTMKAVETASKDTNKAKGLMRGYENGENFWDSNQGSFRGSGGQNEAQKKFFALLGKSDMVMKQLTDTLSNMPDDLNAGQQKIILEFKKGMADFKANGGDVSQFSTLINLLNNTKLDKIDANKNSTVEEFEEKFKPKN